MHVLLLLWILGASAGTVELLPVEPGHQAISVTVSTGAGGPTTESFITAILDVDHYPLTASYMGVKAITASARLGTLSDGTVVLHQITGGNMLVHPRQYVTARQGMTRTDTVADVQLFLVKHTRTPDLTFPRPYADVLNAHREEAVYTPYTHGTWHYDRSAGTIRYSTESDAGGSLPSWAVSEAAVTAFPKELMKVRWASWRRDA